MLHWLYPEVFVDETNTHFKEAFCLGDGKVDPVFLGHVKKFLEIIMIRRIKESMMAELQLPPKKEVTMYLPLTESQKRLYLEILTNGSDDGNLQVDQHDCQILMTPPQSPGFENNDSYSATQPESKVTKRWSMTNILMELRKVSQ